MQAICAKVGIDTRDRLDKGSKKRKFLIAKPLDFTVRGRDYYGNVAMCTHFLRSHI